ncbi:MAG: hypothetical protein H6828_07430 [Planctomycetes bacterium]|nr:hypothetical protein [Planctomycetota bacterium]
MQWTQLIEGLHVGQSRGRKAPHKAMLLLALLARAAAGERNALQFEDFRRWFDPRVRQLGLSTEARYPFWHLQHELAGRAWGLWTRAGGRVSLDARPGQRWFREANPEGRLNEDLWSEVVSRPLQAKRMTELLLTAPAVDPAYRQALKELAGSPE